MATPCVLVSDPLSEEGVSQLRSAGFTVDVITGLSEDALSEKISHYDALIIRSQTKVTARVIQAANGLKIIARAGVGVDNVDLEAATKKGIIVVNSPEGNTEAAAELTVTMMLALCRQIPAANASLKAGKWERSKFTGVELLGKTLGVIGLGKIGSRVATVALALGMKIVAYDPFVSEDAAKKQGFELASLDDVIAQADVITLHIPKTRDTANLINADRLRKMKKGVRIVNCARGGVIDEKALFDAIQSGHVAGAALDVFDKEPPGENPLLTLPQVVATPHLGAATVEAQVNVATDVVEQVIDVLKGGSARAAVNIPSMKPEILQAVKPYMGIAERLGRFIGQVVDGALTSIDVTYQGEIAEANVAPLTVAVLKGLFEPILQETVNFVNAPVVARERGVKVTESKSGEVQDFANLITVSATTEKGKHSVAGTLFGAFGERMVMMDGFKTDVVPRGYLLVMSHTDKPGMIGKMGMILGNKNINIAGMDVGRQSVGGKAVMILNVDSPVPDDVLRDITKIDGIQWTKLVSL